MEHPEKTEEQLAEENAALLARVAELEALMADLTNEKSLFRALYENSPFGVVLCRMIYDEDGEAVDFVHTQGNSATETQTGFDLADIVGKKASEIASPGEIAELIAMYGEVVETGIPTSYEEYFPVYDRTLQVTAFPLLDEAFIINFMDISDRKRAETELAEMNERLEALVEERTAEANQASMAKSDFLAAMSHELRTPLNSIIGFSGVLLSEAPGSLTAEQRRQQEMIAAAGQRLLSHVNDILDLSRIEAGETKLNVGEVLLGDTVSAAADLLRTVGEEAGLEIAITIADPDTPLQTDLRAIEQVLINLASNATKFTESGTIGLDASVTEGGRAVFCVSDTGVGISEEDQHRVFEQFRQAGTPKTDDPSRGVGLGLAISLRLAEMLGGTLTVESVLGEGSRFTLDIPADLETVAGSD